MNNNGILYHRLTLKDRFSIILWLRYTDIDDSRDIRNWYNNIVFKMLIWYYHVNIAVQIYQVLLFFLYAFSTVMVTDSTSLHLYFEFNLFVKKRDISHSKPKFLFTFLLAFFWYHESGHKCHTNVICEFQRYNFCTYSSFTLNCVQIKCYVDTEGSLD